MRLAFVLSPLCLSACTPLVGEWEGDATCGDVEQHIDFELEWDNDHYEGEGLLTYNGSAGGFDAELRVEFDVEVDPEIDNDGDLDVEAESTKCHYVFGGDEIEYTCTTALDPDAVFTWDRADVIEISGSCDGELEREK